MYKEYVLSYKLKTSPYLWTYACVADSENAAIEIFKKDPYGDYDRINIEYVVLIAVNDI